MKRRVISMAMMVALILMAVLPMAASASTASCPHTNRTLLAVLKKDAMNYGNFHYVREDDTWYCYDCGVSYTEHREYAEAHTLPCSICGGVTMGVEEPEETI